MTSRIRPFSLACAVALALAGIPASLPADVLVLKDGKRVEGDVTEEGDTFTVKTRYGSLSISKSEVQEVIRGGEAPAAPAAPPAAPVAPPPEDLLPPPAAPVAPPRPAADAASGLVAHYPFDGDAADASGNGHHATIHGAKPVAEGRRGGALAFAGPSYVALPAAATAGLKQFTIALWMRTPPREVPPPPAFWQHPTLVGVGTTGTGSQDFGVFLVNGKAGYFHGLAPARDAFFRSEAMLADDAWHHVAFLNDGANVRVLVDGNLVRGEIGAAGAKPAPVDATPSGQGLSKHPVFIGASSTAEVGMGPAACFYQGLIDDVRIWNRALEPAEIAALIAKASEPVVRLPEPEAEALKAAEKGIRDLYKAEYARKAPADQLALARVLLDQAAQEKGDPAARYVLLREAKDLAAGAGDAATVLAAVDRLAGQFAVDAVALKSAALVVVARVVRTPDAAEALATGCLAVVDEAAAADQYDTALTLLGRAEAAARQAQSASLLAQAQARRKEVEAARGEYAQVRDDFKTLAEKPDDPAANLQAGRYLCLVKGDWERGLPMLAKGSDAALKAVAEKELADPATPDPMASLGDGWWDAAAGKSGAAKSRLLARAAHWYAKALPGVTGLTRARIETRMESALAASVQEGGIPRAGLVFWVEPGRAPAGDEMRELVSGARPTAATCTLAKAGAKALVFAKTAADYPASPAVQAVENEGTLLAWIRPDAGENTGGILDRYVADHDDVSLWVYGGKVAECINWPETKCWPPKLYAESRYTPGRWTMAGFSWDAKTLTFYVDGKPDGSHPLPAIPKKGGTVVNLGSNPPGTPEYYLGQIGAAMIYNRPLRPPEVLAIYQAGRARFPDAPARTTR